MGIVDLTQNCLTSLVSDMLSHKIISWASKRSEHVVYLEQACEVCVQKQISQLSL